jgi:hypothetical protein
MPRVPPIAVSLALCALGYLAVALALLPSADDTLARDRDRDEALALARR